MRYGRLAILQVVVAVLQLRLSASISNNRIHRTKYHLYVSIVTELPYIHRLKSVVLRQQRIKNQSRTLVLLGKTANYFAAGADAMVLVGLAS